MEHACRQKEKQSHDMSVDFKLPLQLLGAKGIATRSKDATKGAPGRTTRNKKLLGAKGTLANTFHAGQGPATQPTSDPNE